MIKLNDRVSTETAQKEKVGNPVVLAGWVQDIKVLGKLAFARLRDREGDIQVVFFPDKFKKFNELKKITRESVVSIKGTVQKSKLKAGGNEILATELDEISIAQTPIPIEFLGKGIETDLSKRLDARYLDLRNPKTAAIFKIKEKAIIAIREFLSKEGFIEVIASKFSGAGAEGGATMFEFNYFGQKAYLNQSQQLYKQAMMACGFEKIYEIGPSFRAEKSHTQRHVTEFTQLDLEMSFIDSEEDIFKLEENLLKYVLDYVRNNCKKELVLLEKEIPTLKIPLPRVTHEEAIKLLQKAGIKIKQGEDIGTAEEKVLGKEVEKKYKNKAFFITKFPWKLEVCKFYWMRDGKYGRGG
ncbi:aspartate--tRNA(Asn) ligase, partial [Candidatus Woesearchaeota archaeon]|nr:aspartate--tRNA(Asn) ligase [Candidatus Woesearchaeota archaeon]